MTTPTNNAGTNLCGDILLRALSFLTLQQLAICRCVSVAWREGARQASVYDEVRVESLSMARHLPTVALCLPYIQSLKLDQSYADFLNNDHHFVAAVAGFRNLSKLRVHYMTDLLRCFSTIRTMSNLVSLDLHGSEQLQWNLYDLRHLPRLKRLLCVNNRSVVGDTNHLSTLLPGLEVVALSGCGQVTGDLLDFSKMPRLHTLFLDRTTVKGDLRQVLAEDFPSLRLCGLSKGIYGASELERVEHAAHVMRGRHRLSHKSKEDCPIYPFKVMLSQHSPDYHERVEQRLYSSARDPPFNIELVEAGLRKGWRWSNYLGGYCDIHWLDSEPTESDPTYADYQGSLPQLLEKQNENIFSGFLEPPTYDEYQTLCRVMQRWQA